MTDSFQRTNGPESLANMVEAVEAPRFSHVFGPVTCAKVAVLAFLFVGLNFWQFQIIYNKCRHDANWSHGFLIPLFSLYLLYIRWDKLAAARRRVCRWGLMLLLLSIVAMALSFVKTFWLCHLAMIPMFMGLVLYLGGPGVLRVTWLPIAYLVLAIPIPDILYGEIALPLQNFAASATGVILQLFGVKISVTASHLTITSISGKQYPLGVVEACSGIRSLMAFVALSVAMAYIDDRPAWQRVILVGSSLPITILCNVIRVATTSAMYVIDKPELGQDFMHTFMGLALLAPALLMLMGLGWLLRNLFVSTEEGRSGAAEGSA